MSCTWDMGVSKNNGTPKSSILKGFSIINHPFWGTPIFGNTHIDKGHFHGLLAFCQKRLKYYHISVLQNMQM